MRIESVHVVLQKAVLVLFQCVCLRCTVLVRRMRSESGRNLACGRDNSKVEGTICKDSLELWQQCAK